MRVRRHPIAAFAAVATLIVLVAVGGARLRSSEASSIQCPPGYELLADVEQNMQDATGVRAQAQAGESYGGVSPDRTCITVKHPEPPLEHGIRRKQLSMVRSAPYPQPIVSAYSSAVTDRQQLQNLPVANTEGSWKPYGKGPLVSDDPSYGQVNGLGLADLMGRLDSLTHDPTTGRLFGVKGTGGVWMSTNLGTTWTSIGDSLPSQIVGAVAYSLFPNGGNKGTVVVVSGDHTFGGNGYTGYGAFYSRDLGVTWQKASGIPDGALGFEIEVDRARPWRVYAATQFGLYRSFDGGVTYKNVNLPTGECQGYEGIKKPGSNVVKPHCQLANVVTDVVVRPPGVVNATGTPALPAVNLPTGTVVAAVGWRGGNRLSGGQPQSPNNGIYRSTGPGVPGEPGTFTKIAPASTVTGGVSTDGFAPQNEVGRVEFGRVIGNAQDKDYLYAIVQDAQALNGCLDFIDPVCVSPPADPLVTVFDGIYVSSDLGDNWVQIANETTMRNPASGSYLIGVGTALGFEPGVQAWYNLYAAPDPTRQVDGVPTRLVFGLEEVWQNEFTNVPLNAFTSWKVVGMYFRGTSCQLLQLGVPLCPPRDFSVTDDRLTTHPDQHDGIWVRDGTGGGATFVTGNDGGFYKEHVVPDNGNPLNNDDELDIDDWNRGNQTGFNTLLPYDVSIARDGVAFAGLQDNGHIKITPGDEYQAMTFGGDGTFAEVDPNNSLIGYEATPFNAMRKTTDGGRTWSSIDPATTADRFINPFEMDHRAITDTTKALQDVSAKHLVTAGNEVVETTFGSDTQAGQVQATTTPPPSTTTDKRWRKVFDLGTQGQPGNAGATPSPTDPVNTMSAIDVFGNNVYVGYCGLCDVLNQEPRTFKSGIATNVNEPANAIGGGGTAQPPQKMTTKGWHIIPDPDCTNCQTASGDLPERFITSIYIDTRDASKKTIYVTMGGYSRRWVPPNTLQDVNANVGVGHLFKSTDGGHSFTEISGNLPDVPAIWVILRAGQIIVGTDIGVFATSLTPSATSPTFRVLGPAPGSAGGLPVVPIATMMLHPADFNTLVAATYGRGVWTYKFTGQSVRTPPNFVGTPTPVEAPPNQTSFTTIASYNFETPTTCDATWTADISTSLLADETAGPPTTWRCGAVPGNTSAGAFFVSPAAPLPPNEEYHDTTTTTLTSPTFTNTGSATGWVFVDFMNKRNTEATFDFLHVDWKTTASSTWNSVPWKKDGATWSSTKNYDGLNPGFPSFSAEGVAFKAPVNASLEIRFRFSSDQLVSFPPFTGTSVDDVVIKR